MQQRDSAIKLQALYRGHIGRLAAMKWAVKKAEIDAMRALQHAAAVAIERIWRGVTGRGEAEERRKYSKRRSAHREWSTVVDISIRPSSFKPVLLPLSRSPLSKTPKQVFFNPINIFDIFYTLYYCFFIYTFFV